MVEDFLIHVMNLNTREFANRWNFIEIRCDREVAFSVRVTWTVFGPLSATCFAWATTPHQLTPSCESLWSCIYRTAMPLSVYYNAKIWWPREDTMKRTHNYSIQTISTLKNICVILMKRLKIWPRLQTTFVVANNTCDLCMFMYILPNLMKINHWKQCTWMALCIFYAHFIIIMTIKG